MSNLPAAVHHDLVVDDAIGRYLATVQRFPILTAEEEKSLALRFQEQGDLDAAKTLVLSHLRLVVRIAREYLGYGLPLSDLLQEGTIGLMKAVRRFDPHHGARLISFAVHWIRAEIHEFIIRNWRMVKIATTKAQRKLFFKLRGLKKDDHALTNVQMHEIAKQLGVRPKDVAVMETRFLSPEVSLEPGDQDEDEVTPLDLVAAPTKSPLEELVHSEEKARKKIALKEALLDLDERSRAIILARWLKEPGATLEELANQHGVSAERIRQIEKKAFKTVRQKMALILAEPGLA